MQKKHTQYRIIGTRNSHLIVSSKSFEKFIVHQFPHAPQQLDYLELIHSKSPSLIPVSHHTIINHEDNGIQPRPNSKIRVTTKFYQSTLEDMLSKSGTFDEDQLINTLTAILELLEELSLKNAFYGMLTPATVCFCDGEIKLGFGRPLNREPGESHLEADLRSLGEMILKLSINEKGSVQDLLRKAQEKYSSKLLNMLRSLLDSAGKNRKKMLSSGKKDPTLLECNSFEYCAQKLQKLDDLASEHLRKSRKIIEKRENNRVK